MHALWLQAGAAKRDQAPFPEQLHTMFLLAWNPTGGLKVVEVGSNLDTAMMMLKQGD